MSWYSHVLQEWEGCPKCGTLADVPYLWLDDADLEDQIYEVNLPLWLQHPDEVSQLRAAVYDKDLIRLVHGSPWGVVSTPSRERLLEWAAWRLRAIKNRNVTNRDTTHIIVGVPGCGKKFFAKLLVAALRIILNPDYTYWASVRTRLPRIRFDPAEEEECLVFGIEDLAYLKRMNCKHSWALWNYLKGCMKRSLTIGFIMESFQTWPETYFYPQQNFLPFNSTVVDYLVYEPLLSTAEYADFFRVLGIKRPAFATFELLQFWTGGRLGRLFDLFGHGPVSQQSLSHLLPSSPFVSHGLPPVTVKFEQQVAWVHLAILNSPKSKLSSSGAIFDLPVFRVDEIEDALTDENERNQTWWNNISLEHVLTKQKQYHCSFRLVSPHIMMQLPGSLRRPERATVVREFQGLLPKAIIFAGPRDGSHQRPKMLAHLLEKHGGPTGSDDITTYFERWLSQVSPEKQQAALLSIFETNSNNNTSTNFLHNYWQALFRSNRPVVVEGFALDAARELFQLVNGRPAGTLEELNSVILTWESPAAELWDFLEGESKRATKVLYIIGCLLPQEESTWKSTGNWLLGSRHSVASQSPGWRVIKQCLLSYPVLMVGCQGAIHNSIMQTKIFNAVFEEPSQAAKLFRIAHKKLPHIPHLRDMAYANRQDFLELLLSLFN